MNQRKKLLLALVVPVMVVCLQGAASSLYAQDFEPLGFGNPNTSLDLPANPLPGGPLSSALSPIDSSAPSLRGEVIKVPSAATSPSPLSSRQPESIMTETTPAISGPATDGGSHAEGDAYPAGESDALFDESSFDSEPYEGQVYDGVVESTVYETSTVFGMSAIGFRRNYGSDRLLSNNFTDRGDTLSTGDTDHGKMGGFEAYLNCRASTGVGWEFRYFGLAPSGNTASLGNDPTTVLVGLNNVSEAAGDPSVADVFADGNFHALTRESSIYNFEFNLLRNRSDINWFNGMLGNVETMVGLRYIDFDESLEYASGSDAGSGPRRLAFNSSVENSLFGAQVGGRSEFNLFNRLGASIGTKFGLFYTNARANRKISGNFADGSTYDPNIVDGTTSILGYDFGSAENDASFLAEIDLGLIYQFGQASRVRLGYRAIGISGVAFASDNIPQDLTNISQLQETFDSRNLRLRGIYFSYELAF